MTTFDFSPLFRTTVGFDRMARLLDTMANEPAQAYPPYNIEVTDEDRYRISMAVAGFSEKDIEITQKESQLIVSGQIDRTDKANASFLHRGIAERNFERRFKLDDHVMVESADIENGMLHIGLFRELPEGKKPRRISVGTKDPKVIESKAA